MRVVIIWTISHLLLGHEKKALLNLEQQIIFVSNASDSFIKYEPSLVRALFLHVIETRLETFNLIEDDFDHTVNVPYLIVKDFLDIPIIGCNVIGEVTNHFNSGSSARVNDR